MTNELPKVFVNRIDKVDNNKEVYYSFIDDKNSINDEANEEVHIDLFEMQKKIDNLFRSNDFIYKKKFHIKTKYEEKDYYIISKSYDYLLTIDGERIYIANIIDIY